MNLNPINSFKNLEALVFFLHVVFPPFLQCCFSDVTLKSNLNIGRGEGWGGECTSASRIFVAGLQIGHVLHSKLFIYRLVINQASIVIPLVLRIFRIKPSISFRIYFLCPWPVIFLWGNVQHFDFDLVFRFQLVTWAVSAFRLSHSHKWWLLKLRGFNFKTDRRGLPVKLRNGHWLGSTNLSVEELITR